MFLKPKASGIVVGLTFTDDAIRLVAVQQLPGGGVRIEQAVSVPLPPDTLAERGIADMEKATDAVRAALEQVAGPVRSVVVGLPSQATIAHGLSVPAVPPKELRAVVRGEIGQLNLLPPGQEAFDFLVFPRPDDAALSKESAAKGDAAFFFAAEQYIVEQFRAVVTDAGFPVAGIEPSEYAATRMVQGQIMNGPLALSISVGSHHTYLQFFHQGLPVYARRLDVGADQILPESGREGAQAASLPSAPSDSSSSSAAPGEATPPTDGALAGIGAVTPSVYAALELDDMNEAPVETPAPASPWQLTGLTMPGIVPPASPTGEPPTALNASVAAFLDVSAQAQGSTARERMMSEVSRSLDYFGREYHADTANIAIVFLANHARLAYLPDRAASALEQSVHSASLEDAALLAASLPQLAANGADYTVALGLALGQMGSQWASIPVMDLGREAAEAARAKKVPRLLIGMGAAGAVLLATGISVAFTLEQEAIPVRMELENTQHTLQGLVLEEQKARSDSMQQMELVRQIRLQNLTWTSVLRNVARAVPTGVGLTRVIVQGGTLGITGDTTDPNRVVQFWSRMNTSPFFAGATVTSMQRTEEKITFQMSVVLPSAASTGMSPSTALGSPPGKTG